MEPDDIVQRMELWQRALSAVQNDIHVLRARYRLLMRVAFQPSRPMQSPTAISLLHSSAADDAPYILLRSPWDAQTDLAKLEGKHAAAPIEPTIDRTETIVDAERARVLHASIDGLTVPVIPRSAPQGLDGTTIEVTIGDYFAGCRFWWWVRPPEDWKAVGVLVDQLLALAN